MSETEILTWRYERDDALKIMECLQAGGVPAELESPLVVGNYLSDWNSGVGKFVVRVRSETLERAQSLLDEASLSPSTEGDPLQSESAPESDRAASAAADLDWDDDVEEGGDPGAVGDPPALTRQIEFAFRAAVLSPVFFPLSILATIRCMVVGAVPREPRNRRLLLAAKFVTAFGLLTAIAQVGFLGAALLHLFR